MFRVDDMMKRYKQGTETFEKIISSIDLQELKGIPLFGNEDDKWYAPEEIVLLTSMQSHSYGNWNLLARILTETFQKTFTPEEVEEHYVNTYLEGDIATAMKSAQPEKSSSSLIDHTSEEDAECLKSADMNAYENVPEEFLKEVGYMPLREDFKREFDPTAEQLIENLDFSDKDEFDRNMNMILLDTYRNIVTERIERKEAVKKYRIVEQFYAKTNPSYEKKFLEDKSLFYNSDSRLPSPEPYHNSKTNEINEISLPSKKTRSRLKNSIARRNPEEKLPHLSDCEDEEEDTPSKKKYKTKKRRCLRSSKSLKLLSVQSDNSSENESVESDRKTSNLTIDEYPDAEHLTEAEKRLCTDLGLMPIYYICYRFFLKYIDTERTEGRYSDYNMIPAQMTVAQCSRIVNFMEKAGLLKNQNLLNIADDDGDDECGDIDDDIDDDDDVVVVDDDDDDDDDEDD